MKSISWSFGVLLISLAFGMSAFAVLPDDIVLYFSFSEGEGTSVKDLSNYGNNGEITGGNPEWVTGEHDGALDLDGKSTVIHIEPSDSLTSLKAPMTIGVIFQIVEFPVEWQCFAEMVATAADRSAGWKMGFHNQNPVFTTYGIADHIANSITLEPEQWVYLVYVFDTSNASFYIDSELKQQVAAGLGINVSESPGLNIGAEGGTPGNWYSHAILDEFWISNTDKSEEEIQELASPETMFSISPKDKLATSWGRIKKY